MSDTAQATEVTPWLNKIAAYEKEFDPWHRRVTKIVKRYRDFDPAREGDQKDTAKFNILWSNVQTLIPAVYAKMPKADVSRRFGDNDPVGRVGGLLVERSLDFEIEHYPDFRAAMRHCVEDRFLGGRGTAWVRYEPHVVAQDEPEDGLEVTDTVETETQPEDEEGPKEQIDYECAPVDYVHWKDFGHVIARTWDEVPAVWRVVYMTKDQIAERFPDKGEKIPLDSSPEPLDGKSKPAGDNDRAKIYEIWDKDTKKAIWLSKSLPEFIDVQDDPLGLEGFFPCPEPLYATTTSDSLVPVPDFVFYQNQADELDILSDRIDGLVKALRVRGVYDQSVPALQRLLTEGDNNTLIPVEAWGKFVEKGGLKGCFDLLPIDTLAAALLQCYDARTQIKDQIYEITGISDIIRGQTAASETATAQQIKGQYASLRLKNMQDAVAMFASQILKLKAQIICTKFQPEANTILKYAAADQLSPADQQAIPQALQLIRSNPLRSFRIEVEADSLVQIDEEQTKQDRMDFLEKFGTFMQQAVAAGAQVPELAPLLMDSLKYAVGAFKQARTLEGSIDQALEALKQKALQIQQQGPQPSPEEKKAQVEAAAQAQSDQVRAQVDTQTTAIKEQARQAIEAQRLQFEGAMNERELQMQQRFDQWKEMLEQSTKIIVAQITAKQATDTALIQAESAADANAAGSLQ